MTSKPFLYVFNSDEAVLTDDAKKAELAEPLPQQSACSLMPRLRPSCLSSTRTKRWSSSSPSAVTEPGLATLAKAGFNARPADLPDCWSEGSPRLDHQAGFAAPQAAGVIHTDFEKKFIKAEIVSFDDLDAAGTMAEARAEGKVRQEGKDYIMQDGDVCDFKIGG